MRKVLFWTHLVLGLAAGIVILIMSVTGVLLTYERQMIEWADRGYRPAVAGTRLPPEALLRTAAPQLGTMPASLTLHSDPEAAAEATVGQRVVYIDPYSGLVLGEGSQAIRRFFRVVTDWHRWLALEGAKRQFGRSITGAANLFFLGLVLTGMVLWLPRKWGWSQVRAVLLFRGGLSGKARDFNWHNVIGIWSVVPLALVVLGAVVISYPWATGLVYRIAGDEAPPSPMRGVLRGGGREDAAPDLAGLNNAWKQAEAKTPGWRTIAWRAAGGNRITLAIAESHRGRVNLRSTLVVNRATGESLQHETFGSYSRGRQWRLWLRFIHTGEALGAVGQTVAGLVSTGGAVLVWTGIALAWRRFRAWRARTALKKEKAPVGGSGAFAQRG